MGIPGGYPGGLYRDLPNDRAEEPTQHLTAERAPEALQGLEWVVRCVRGGRALVPPLRGPVSPPVGFPVPGPLNAASWPIRRDSMSSHIKLVKTTKCRRNVSKRPVIVPNSQNGSQMSPLDFLRFP